MYRFNVESEDYTNYFTISKYSQWKWESGIPIPHSNSVVTMILNVVDGVDVTTKEGSEDVIRLHRTGRRSCDSVTG